MRAVEYRGESPSCATITSSNVGAHAFLPQNLGLLIAFSAANLLKIIQLRAVFCVLWLVTAGGGFYALSSYQNAAGSVGGTPQSWPAGTKVLREPHQATFVMFAHPRCPCTRASVEELNRLLAQCPGRVSAQVWFFKPDSESDSWVQTDLWRTTAAIPGVVVHEDVGGAQAHIFGAETSGFVLLYDARGQLLFKGGITGARGHGGDNAGESALRALLTGNVARLKQTQVYGCSLLDKCELASKEPAR